MSLNYRRLKPIRISSERSSRGKIPVAPTTFSPMLEALEQRTLFSTLTVVNNLDSGAGSLRASIAAAHNGDTIAFASGMAGQTITLTSGELLLKHPVTIAGPTDRSVTVSGGRTWRVFELSGQTKPVVTLSGLTISDGYAPGPFGHSTDNGGGILNEGALTVSNCTVSYNSAPRGAGILNDAGATLTVSNSSISWNTGRDQGGSSEGGGIDNYGTLFVHASTLSYNSVSGGGGAIFTAIGAVTIDSQTTLSNNAAGGGGAICGSAGMGRALTINDCTLSDNHANFSGGAISFGGTLALNRCTLTGNSASPPPNQTGSTRGGAIYLGADFSFGCTVTISGCTLSGNSATQGGGMYLFNSGYPCTVTVGGCAVTGNSATQGAGIYNAISQVAALSVSNTTFSLDTPDYIFGMYSDGGGNIFA